MGKKKSDVKSNNYTYYDDEVVDKLDLIRDAKSVGFTLSEIKELIDAWYSKRITKEKKLMILDNKLLQIEEKINELEEFRFLLRKFQADGAPIFNVLKTKPLIYEGNYREYKMTSIKSVEILTIDKKYLRNKYLPGANTSKKQEERKEELND